MKIKALILASVVGVAVGVAPAVYAATTANSTLTQTISAGTISTSIRDAAGDIVSSPSFAMTSGTVSTSTQTSTGTFGSNTQRITVDNPNGSVTGGAWTLALNATTPGTGVWSNGSATYPYNGTASTGQLTVNPAAGTITATVGTTTNVTLGTQSTFSGSTPITLVTASTTAEAIWNGYVTGIGLSQIIPANTPTGSYSISMTQTVTAQ